MKTALKPLIAGNWKMNGLKSSLAELDKVVTHLASSGDDIDVMFLLPATLLAAGAEKVKNSPVNVGGQDCHANQSGAHTGDISAEMLADSGGSAVIIGHSERRTDHRESDDMVRAKAISALQQGLAAILCIGESESERKSGQTLDVLTRQLDGSLPDLNDQHELIVAYEPVWAIGTGLVPSLDDVAEAHGHIRLKLIERYGEKGKAIRILYGGSVKPSNAAQLLAVDEVNGALVGGASLKADDLVGIISAAR